MPDIQIIPKGRDATAKKQYQFMNWWVRKNKKDIESEVTKLIEEQILYGKPRITTYAKEE